MAISENLKVTGIISAYSLPKKDADELQHALEESGKHEDLICQPFVKNWLKTKKAKKLFEVKNQILQDGFLIYLNRGPQSVSRILAGNQIGPTASTYNTQQSIQAPLPGLEFPRIGQWETSVLSNGYQYSFNFRRPAASNPSAVVTEMALKVVDGVNEANLSRIVSPSSALPHTFSNTQDTIAIWDLRFTV